VLAAASGDVPRAAAGNAAVPEARLTGISSRASARSASLVIEATAPVPYLTTRPDPLTVLLDFRNVGAEGMANVVKADARGPIGRVAIEATESMGSPVSRVRISLLQPVAHRVRSERNTVVVEFERTAAKDAPVFVRPVLRGGVDAASLTARIETPAVDPIAALGLSQRDQAPRQLAGGAPVARATATPSLPPTTASTIVPPTNVAQAAQAAQAAPPAAQATTNPLQAPEFQASPRSPRQYTGNPVSLDFQQADLRAVLRVFSEISGLNIVIDPAVQGTVDVALRDVPWDQALDIILRANKLGYLVDGTIVRIAPLSALADEESQRRKLADQQALAGDLRVFTRTLSYARAQDLQELITKSALSPRGTVQIDTRTNTMIITDLQDRLNTASELIMTLDRAQPQVEIEARIVQTTKDYARALGVQWGFQGRVDPALGNTTNMAFPNNGRLAGAAGVGSGGAPSAVNLAAAGASSALGLALGSVNGAFNLDIALTALENSGNARILSTPRVSTQNNVEAEIAQGVQVPYQTTANNTVTTNFKDAALVLKVMPQITAANTVILKITVDNGSVGPSFGGVPSINTQRANTTVQVSDGQTTVLGGIYATNERTSADRTPGFGRVPFLNWLFKRDTINEQSTELLIFITPRIIKG
jgi:type IV pilus assembly protein PilQ